MEEEQTEQPVAMPAEAPVESTESTSVEAGEPIEEKSDIIERPAENYREEEIAETIGSLRVSRKYGVAHLPKLNIDAYIPSYLFMKEIDEQKETRVWKVEITMVKKYVDAEGEEVKKEDVMASVDGEDYAFLRKCIAYTMQHYEMTKEKKSS